MATQYQIFCRYLNETVNRTLTNQTKSEWISASEFKTLKEYYNINKDAYDKLCDDLRHGIKRKSQFTVEELNGFDLVNILNKPCQLQIITEEKNNKPYTNIASIMAICKLYTFDSLSMIIQNSGSIGYLIVAFAVLI